LRWALRAAVTKGWVPVFAAANFGRLFGVHLGLHLCTNGIHRHDFVRFWFLTYENVACILPRVDRSVVEDIVTILAYAITRRGLRMWE
jgi:hypothetical protein